MYMIICTLHSCVLLDDVSPAIRIRNGNASSNIDGFAAATSNVRKTTHIIRSSYLSLGQRNFFFLQPLCFVEFFMRLKQSGY